MDRRVTGLASKSHTSHVTRWLGALVLASTWMLLLTAYPIIVADHRTDVS